MGSRNRTFGRLARPFHFLHTTLSRQPMQRNKPTKQELISKLDALIEKRGYSYEGAANLVADGRLLDVLKRKKYGSVSREAVEAWLRRL